MRKVFQNNIKVFVLIGAVLLGSYIGLGMLVWSIFISPTLNKKAKLIRENVYGTHTLMICLQKAPEDDPCHDYYLDKNSIDMKLVKQQAKLIQRNLGFRAGSRIVGTSFERTIDWRTGITHMTYFSVGEYQNAPEILERYRIRIDEKGNVKFLEISLHSTDLNLNLFLVQNKIESVELRLLNVDTVKLFTSP